VHRGLVDSRALSGAVSPDTLALLERLSDGPGTADIPVVVLAASLATPEARRALAAGAVTLLPHTGDVDVLVGEVDTLIAVASRPQRALKRRLLDLQELARHYKPDAAGQAALRHLIDRLQVAIFAVDQQGHCIAASEGATTLTGYSRRQLLHTSVFKPGFAGGRVSDERWQVFLMNRHFAGATTITNRDGDDVTVHAAAVAEVMPGLHVAAFAAA
jgi:PAS domain S-box-containing protein